MTVGLMGSRADNQERILENSFWCKKGDFIEAWGQDPWAGRAALDHEERLVLYCGVGGGKVPGKFPERFSYAKDSQVTGG